MAGDGIVVVYVTAPEARAPDIARALVEERVVACVNLLPNVRSIYRWEGKVSDDRETLMLLKTTADRLGAVRAAVKKLHPYQTPEIVAVAAADVNAEYAAWVRESVGVGT